MQRGHKKSLNGFKFGTFIGRFPCDREASMAVKGLIKSNHSIPSCRDRQTDGQRPRKRSKDRTNVVSLRRCMGSGGREGGGGGGGGGGGERKMCHLLIFKSVQLAMPTIKQSTLKSVKLTKSTMKESTMKSVKLKKSTMKQNTLNSVKPTKSTMEEEKKYSKISQTDKVNHETKSTLKEVKLTKSTMKQSTLESIKLKKSTA